MCVYASSWVFEGCRERGEERGQGVSILRLTSSWPWSRTSLELVLSLALSSAISALETIPSLCIWVITCVPYSTYSFPPPIIGVLMVDSGDPLPSFTLNWMVSPKLALTCPPCTPLLVNLSWLHLHWLAVVSPGRTCHPQRQGPMPGVLSRQCAPRK